jgi:hypothetical protein
VSTAVLTELGVLAPQVRQPAVDLGLSTWKCNKNTGVFFERIIRDTRGSDYGAVAFDGRIPDDRLLSVLNVSGFLAGR